MRAGKEGGAGDKWGKEEGGDVGGSGGGGDGGGGRGLEARACAAHAYVRLGDVTWLVPTCVDAKLGGRKGIGKKSDETAKKKRGKGGVHKAVHKNETATNKHTHTHIDPSLYISMKGAVFLFSPLL